MTATREEISGWFDRGVANGSAVMLVICDTFDWDDYPSYCSTIEEARKKAKSPGEMQRVMESYDLTQPKEPQLAKARASCL